MKEATCRKPINILFLCTCIDEHLIKTYMVHYEYALLSDDE